MAITDSLPQKQDRHLTTYVDQSLQGHVEDRRTSHGVVLIEEFTVISRNVDSVSTVSPHFVVEVPNDAVAVNAWAS